MAATVLTFPHPPSDTGFRLWALVPCAGTGTRAGTQLPKQYEQVAGQEVLAHTLAALTAVSRITHTLVVVAPGDERVASVVSRWPGHCSSVACGGASRALTVAHGLEALQQRGAAEHDWVLVHDAARCLLLPEWVDQLVDACERDAVGGLLAHPVSDTLKLGEYGRVAGTTDRSRQWLAQTPQMFRLGMLQLALRKAGEAVTDESSAIEALGHAPRLVRGSALNFKLTYAEDFLLARALLLDRARGQVRGEGQAA